MPTAHTKGVLVAPTVFGNVMLGPTADDIDDKTATGSTRAGIDSLLEKGRRILPQLIDEEVTSVYAGLRAATEHSDYQVSHHRDLRYVCLGGIRSTGLTSSMALAEEALSRLIECGLAATSKEAPQPDPDDTARRGRRTAVPTGWPDRLPLRAGDDRGGRRGPRRLGAGRRLRRIASSHAGAGRRCQGFYCQAELCNLTGWSVAP